MRYDVSFEFSNCKTKGSVSDWVIETMTGESLGPVLGRTFVAERFPLLKPVYIDMKQISISF